MINYSDNDLFSIKNIKCLTFDPFKSEYEKINKKVNSNDKNKNEEYVKINYKK
jgi:hypothetical protein